MIAIVRWGASGGISARRAAWRSRLAYSMSLSMLSIVVLDTDLPEHGFETGDLGAVVEVYEADGLEIEFVSAAGQTHSLVTLKAGDVRPVLDNLAVNIDVEELLRNYPSLNREAIQAAIAYAARPVTRTDCQDSSGF